jgi:muramoyltetrapeptide carboxypeptidase
VDYRDVLNRKHQRFAGTDVERLAELHAIGNEPEQGIALTVRGGYGMHRLLPQLDFARIARQAEKQGTLIVGHSDFTAFHLGYLAQTGGVSFAGPALCADFGAEPLDGFMLEQFRAVTTQAAVSIDIEAPQASAGTVAGTLWGGNLAMLCSLVGTPWMPDVRDGILFVEDVNEQPFRVERMLLHLLYAGILERQQALLLGDFSSYKTYDYDNGYGLDDVVALLRERLSIPVFTGLPFGHTPRKLTLPVGGQARVEARPAGFTLSLSGYPTLAHAA